MTRTKIGILGVCAAIVSAAGLAIAQQDPGIKDDLSKGSHGADVSPETQARAMELMMEAINPGPEHARLEAMAGEWKVTTTLHMDPTQAPMVVEGRTVNEMILGGRFLQSRTFGEFMGQPFESLGILGFDRRTGKHTVTAYDTMGTYSVAAEGDWNESTRSMDMHGTTHDPRLNATERYRFVYRQETPDRYVMEVIFRMPDDKELTVVSSVTVRAK